MLEYKSNIIVLLTAKLDELKYNYERLEQSYNQDVLEMNSTTLSNDLASTKEMCAHIRMEKDELELQLTNNPMLIQKVFEEEEKQKLSSEKFNKLKLMYTQIRDEHINLLRQHSDHSKSLNKEKQISAELLLQIKDLNNEILRKNEAITSHEINAQKLSQQVEALSQEKEELKNQYSILESVKKDLITKYEARINEKEIENIELNAKVNDLKEFNVELNTVKLLLQEKEQQLADAKSLSDIKDKEITETLKNNEEKIKQISTELSSFQLVFQEKEKKLVDVESLLDVKDKEISEIIEKCEEKCLQLSNKKAQLQETLEMESQAVYAIMEESDAQMKQKELALLELEATLTLLNQERLKSAQLSTEMQQIQSELANDLHQALTKADLITFSNKQCEDKLLALRKLTIQTVREICLSKLNDGAQQPLEIVQKLSSEIDTLLKKLRSSSKIPIDDCDDKIHDIIYLGYYFIKLYEQCDIIYTTTTDIEKGQDVFNKVRSIWPELIKLFEIIEYDDKSKEFESLVEEINMNLIELNALVQGILSNFENSVDLGKMIEIELKEMDAAIEEAASKIIDLLSKSRENDNKIKLEVNEKILEACTALMECIKILILKSRVLQQEIVSSQKGNASANEFYKRNSQWSDGLISASKSVAKAANYLVEAANNAINSDSGQNFELIVAAQEIAACTAQLVIASKVKANRNSENLVNLTTASRNVTKATGVVVATVKDGNSRQEQQQEIDLCKLTPSQLKTMEMEIHVKVLELEQALQSQRFKLSAFRREHYQKIEY